MIGSHLRPLSTVTVVLQGRRKSEKESLFRLGKPAWGSVRSVKFRRNDHERGFISVLLLRGTPTGRGTGGKKPSTIVKKFKDDIGDI